MQILFLGGNSSKELADWLASIGEDVVYTEDRIDLDFVKSLNEVFIVSYNYRYIIPKNILEHVKGRAINLHISYLPWNKGAYPNVWSFLENTPKGVTIHCIDEEIDSGDIIIQKEIIIDENKETLATSYALLHENIKALFKSNWSDILSFQLQPKKQIGDGSVHYKKELDSLSTFIMDNGWDTPIKVVKQNYEIWKSHHNLFDS